MPELTPRSAAPAALPLMKTAAYLMAWTGVSLFFGYVAWVMSWAGHRPLKPDSLHPYLFNNHGIMYVSASDLWGSRVLLAAAVVLVATALVLRAWIRKFDPSFDRRT